MFSPLEGGQSAAAKLIWSHSGHPEVQSSMKSSIAHKIHTLIGISAASFAKLFSIRGPAERNAAEACRDLSLWPWVAPTGVKRHAPQTSQHFHQRMAKVMVFAKLWWKAEIAARIHLNVDTRLLFSSKHWKGEKYIPGVGTPFVISVLGFHPPCPVAGSDGS